MVSRCAWVTDDPLYIAYHDEEWGRPVHDDRKLFEMLTLEGAQAGLSWITILKRRENYRNAFDNFNPQKVSRYDEEKVDELLNNEGIIRNELKTHSVNADAKSLLEIQRKSGSFDRYIRKLVEGKQKINQSKHQEDVPRSSNGPEAMSKDLKNRCFKSIGPRICYA